MDTVAFGFITDHPSFHACHSFSTQRNYMSSTLNMLALDVNHDPLLVSFVAFVCLTTPSFNAPLSTTPPATGL